VWKRVKFNSRTKILKKKKKMEQYGGYLFRIQTIKIKRILAGQSLKQLTWRNFT
jgi:hypothetical protein